MSRTLYNLLTASVIAYITVSPKDIDSFYWKVVTGSQIHLLENLIWEWDLFNGKYESKQ